MATGKNILTDWVRHEYQKCYSTASQDVEDMSDVPRNTAVVKVEQVLDVGDDDV